MLNFFSDWHKSEISKELETIILMEQFGEEGLGDARAQFCRLKRGNILYIWGKAGTGKHAIAHIIKWRSGKDAVWLDQWRESRRDRLPECCRIIIKCNATSGDFVHANDCAKKLGVTTVLVGNDPPPVAFLSPVAFNVSSIYFGRRVSNASYLRHKPIFEKGHNAGLLRRSVGL